MLGLEDTSLPTRVKCARHALAYHEQRSYFDCTPFTLKGDDHDPQRLLQVWFPGVHRDVGGGYKEHQIADISLLWMAGEAQKAGVGLDVPYLDSRLSKAHKLLDVHFETIPPPQNGIRRKIYEETIKNLATTRCHRSLWGSLSHLHPDRESYWERPENLLKPPKISLAELNGIEKEFWELRWGLTIPDPNQVRVRLRGRGPSPAPAPDLNQVHEAPDEEESFNALFG